jgi:hypothetical protein
MNIPNLTIAHHQPATYATVGVHGSPKIRIMPEEGARLQIRPFVPFSFTDRPCRQQPATDKF